MKLSADYHTHTIYSDGKGTMEDNIKEAIKKGLKTIAISDHGPSHILYGVKKKNIVKMREEIDILKEKYPEIKILLAVEANVLGLDGSIDISSEQRKYYDVILCGYHFGSTPKVFFRDIKIHICNVFSGFVKCANKKALEYNTESICNAIKLNDIKILTHPGAKGPVDILKIAKIAEKYNTLLEVNNTRGSGHLTEEEIKTCMKTNVKFVICSDAHVPEDVGTFEKALSRITNAKLDLSRVVNISEVEQ